MSSDVLEVLLSSLLKISAAACQLSALLPPAATALWWQLARTPRLLLLPTELWTRAAT